MTLTCRATRGKNKKQYKWKNDYTQSSRGVRDWRVPIFTASSQNFFHLLPSFFFGPASSCCFPGIFFLFLSEPHALRSRTEQEVTTSKTLSDLARKQWRTHGDSSCREREFSFHFPKWSSVWKNARANNFGLPKTAFFFLFRRAVATSNGLIPPDCLAVPPVMYAGKYGNALVFHCYIKKRNRHRNSFLEQPLVSGAGPP